MTSFWREHAWKNTLNLLKKHWASLANKAKSSLSNIIQMSEFSQLVRFLKEQVHVSNDSFMHLAGLLVGRGKKSQISWDFQGQICGKNGRFRRNFARIFEASFAEK